MVLRLFTSRVLPRIPKKFSCTHVIWLKSQSSQGTAAIRFSTLVSSEWLNRALNNTSVAQPLRVLDVSFVPDKTVDGYSEFFQAGHIPGARYFDLHKYVDSTELIPRNLLSVPDFEKYMKELGVSSDTHIVTYDRTTNMAAVRLWWMMRLYGHDRTSVLDGGMSKWVADGFPVTTDEVADNVVSDFQATFRPELLRNYDDVLKNIENKHETLVDARPRARFSGTDVNGGHIPGSKNVPFTSLFKDDGTFKSADDLRKLFEIAGVDLTKPVVATCGTGMTACSIALTASLLGRDSVPVYYGSWTEWSGRAPRELLWSSDSSREE